MAEGELPESSKAEHQLPLSVSRSICVGRLCRWRKMEMAPPIALVFKGAVLAPFLEPFGCRPGRNAPSFRPCFLVERFGFCQDIVLCFFFELLGLFPSRFRKHFAQPLRMWPIFGPLALMLLLARGPEGKSGPWTAYFDEGGHECNQATDNP